MSVRSTPLKPNDLHNMAFHCQDEPITAPTGPSFRLAVEQATSDGHDWPRCIAATQPSVVRLGLANPPPIGLASETVPYFLLEDRENGGGGGGGVGVMWVCAYM